MVLSGLDVLVVALDGASPETYQKYRRGGDIELVIHNMRRIQAMKQLLGYPTPSVVWQFLIFQHNEHEVSRVAQEYKAWGADEYCVGGAYMPVGDLAAGFAPSADPKHNIYDTNHLHRRKSVQASMERKPCSWLYGATVLNSNGKLSPCSYTAAEKDDFGEYTGQDFRGAWNAPRFAQARASQKDPAWQKGDSWESIGTRMNGRAMNVALDPGQLICERCPVPFLQDMIDHELTFEQSDLIGFIERTYELTAEERLQLDGFKAALA